MQLNFVYQVDIYIYIYTQSLKKDQDNISISTYNKAIYRVSQEEWTKLWESVPYVKIYQYNPKHLCPKLNGYGENGQRSLKL